MLPLSLLKGATPTITVNGKVCSAAFSITPGGIGVGGWCSLENLKGGTRRVVSGHIVSEGP